MAKRTITLTQYAAGSWTDNIGDWTLFYTGESSIHAKDIEGVFGDNPPKLSPDCATIVWRYYADVDRYLLVHVQGSHVVNQALGRNYPFRAAYEVSRADMNGIGSKIPAIIKAIPRIGTMKGGRLPLETMVDDAEPWPAGLMSLKTNVERALFSRQRLYIELDVAGKPYRGDGIFAAPELSILLGSIGMLDEDVRRYASFAFCADYIAEPVLDDVLVVVYQKGRNMRIPNNAIQTTWAQATTETVVTADSPRAMLKLPGAHEPLFPLALLFKAMNVECKGVSQLQGEDWEIWLNIGHKLSDLPVTGWTDFANFYHRMNDGIQHVFRNTFLDQSVNWSLDGLTPEWFHLMAVTDPQTGAPAYSEQQRELIQAKALRHYLQDDGSYTFLFSDGALSAHLRRCLVEPAFINSLELNSKEDVERLYDRYVSLKLSDDKQVQTAWMSRFRKLALPELKTLTDVIAYMTRYPFISSSCYDRQPKIDLVPNERDLQELSESKKNLINQWIDAEVKKQSVTDIEELLDLLNAISIRDKTADSLKLRFLQGLKPSALYAALREAHDGKSACEQLLSYSVSLPKEWNDFALNTILPAVRLRLFGDSGHPECLFQYDFNDISEWGRICTDYASGYPYIFKLITHRFQSLITDVGADPLADEVKKYFSPKAETLPAKNEIIFDLNPQKKSQAKGKQKNKIIQANSLLNTEEANNAYPLIKILLKSMKSNHPQAQELKDLFSELKAVRKAKRMKYSRIAAFIMSFLLGALLATGVILSCKEKCTQRPPANNLHVNQGEHPMVAIANCSEEEKIDTVFVDDAPFTELIPDSMESLQTFSDKYYTQFLNDDCFRQATVFLSKDSLRDSMIIAANNPLLKIANMDSFRVDSIKVDSILIDLNHASIAGSTSDPNYYLQVIKAISKQMPDSLKNQIAY